MKGALISLTKARFCRDGRLHRGEPSLGGEGLGRGAGGSTEQNLTQSRPVERGLLQDFPASEGAEAIWDSLRDSLESRGLSSAGLSTHLLHSPRSFSAPLSWRLTTVPPPSAPRKTLSTWVSLGCSGQTGELTLDKRLA